MAVPDGTDGSVAVMDPIKLVLLTDRPHWAYDRIARGVAPWLNKMGFASWIGYCTAVQLDEALAMGRDADVIFLFGYPIYTKHGFFKDQTDRLMVGVWDSAYLEDPWTCERLSKARATVCFNRAIYAVACARGLRNAVLVSPSVGVDPVTFIPKIGNERAAKIRLGFVGDLDRSNKRLDLITAVMGRASTEVEFIFTDLPGKKNQQLLTEASLVHYYQALDCLLSVSDYEGGPLPPIEAAACGVPSIATPVGILSEFIEPGVNGLLINGNLHELSSAIARLLHEEDLLARMKRAARPRALEWRWEVVAGAYARAIEKVFQRNPSCVELSAQSV